MSLEGDQLSGEEPGRVPPDHKTTTEFEIPAARPDEPAATAEPAGDQGEATVVDRPIDPGDTARDDVRNDWDDLRDDPDATAFDVPRSPSPAGEAPTETDATVTDFRSEGGPGAGADEPPATVVDLRKERAEGPPLLADVPEAPWTAQFGAEAAETTGERPGPPVGPAAAGSAAAEAPTAPTPVGPTPSHLQAEAPTAPHGARPAESPAGPPPPGPPPAPGREGRGRSRKPAVLVAAVAAVLIVGAGAAAALVLSRGEDDPSPTRAQPTSPAATTPPATPTTPGATPTTGPAAQPTAAPTSPGTQPAPGQQPTAPSTTTPPTAPPTTAPVGPLRTGDGITYQLVQQDPGYFESRMVITNRSTRPLRSWKITFEAPGANVRNIWGGRLVRRGSKVEIHNLPDGVPLPPGATWQIQYGASGTPVDPKGCRLGDKPCGF